MSRKIGFEWELVFVVSESSKKWIHNMLSVYFVTRLFTGMQRELEHIFS